ncbi:MAG: sulfide/dihydroorotate dehydrogenase-like FAD/NAD-binding protein [Thermotogota bacterium]|nr:sulfide/dihydroorotate dehydrogenase-like FAD/NAD-binding protein [Thermotogota bacterium]
MNNKIISKNKLASKIYEFHIEHDTIPKFYQAGQFAIIRISENGERIPLTIVDAKIDYSRFIVKCIGKTTYKLAMMKEGAELLEVVGPLGNPAEVDNFGNVVVIGGGIGIAPILPIARALKDKGNSLTVIIGAVTSEQIILKDELRKTADNLIITTDDGTTGEKGLVTERLEELITNNEKIDRIWAVGPTVMMKFVSAIAKREVIPCMVSLNSIMVDGTGMCGACRVEVNGEMKFTCVDGPEFDGRFVNWDELIKRQHQYTEEEEKALEHFKKEVGDLSWL